MVAEAPAPGVTVSQVSPRPGIAESLIHNWRLAQRKAVSIANELVQQFIPYGGVTDAAAADPVMALTPVPITPALAPAKPSSPAKATDAPVARTRGARSGGIDIDLPAGVGLSVDSYDNEKARSSVLRALEHAS